MFSVILIQNYYLLISADFGKKCLLPEVHILKTIHLGTLLPH